MSKWPSVRLGEICEANGGIQTGPFGSQLHQKDYVVDGTPIITVEHLGENRIIHSDMPRVTETDRLRLAKYSLREGDIVFSRVGSVDRRALVRHTEDGWLFSGRCLRIRLRKDLADPVFISAQFGLPSFREYVRSIAVGATMPSLNTQIMSDLFIQLPPIEVQREIGELIGSLEEQIDLNRQMNETLEAIARLCFKDWFVDFGPTRAKMEGRPPYLAPELWALFPDALDDEGKPVGWETGTLSTIARLNPDTWGSKNAPRSVEYVDLANTKWGEIEQTQLFAWENAPSRARRILHPGDTIIGTVRPGNGSFALVGASGLTGSTGFAVLRPKYPEYREAVYISATSPETIETLSHLADGAAYPAVRPEVVASKPIIVPCQNCLKAFSAKTAPLIDSVLANRDESRTLAQTRDLLLPKLMSGEIRLRDAEKLVEKVA